MSPWSCQMDKYWPSYGQRKSGKKIFWMWPIIPTSFPPTPRVKNRRLNVWKTSCDSSTHFAYFYSWQKVDGEISIVKFGHHSRACLEGLTNFGVFGVPPYSPFCTLKIHTFDPKHLENPKNNRQNQIPWLLIYHVCKLNLNQVISYSGNQNILKICFYVSGVKWISQLCCTASTDCNNPRIWI
jgi:hypothetical protein